MNVYRHVKSGRRADLGDIYFHSSMESNYARYLNWLIKKDTDIVKWEYEPQIFWFDKIKRGTRSYTPDFKVYFSDEHIEYHEVKGYDYPKGKTARKRFAKYYPEHKLVQIDTDFFKALKRIGIHSLIDNWE